MVHDGTDATLSSCAPSEPLLELRQPIRHDNQLIIVPVGNESEEPAVLRDVVIGDYPPVSMEPACVTAVSRESTRRLGVVASFADMMAGLDR